MVRLSKTLKKSDPKLLNASVTIEMTIRQKVLNIKVTSRLARPFISSNLELLFFFFNLNMYLMSQGSKEKHDF